LFGENEWRLLEEFESAGQINRSSSKSGFKFTSTDNRFSGTWSISGYLYEKLVIVLKGGNKAPASTLLYLVSLGEGYLERVQGFPIQARDSRRG
jgi:hypothetical protein